LGAPYLPDPPVLTCLTCLTGLICG